MIVDIANRFAAHLCDDAAALACFVATCKTARDAVRRFVANHPRRVLFAMVPRLTGLPSEGELRPAYYLMLLRNHFRPAASLDALPGLVRDQLRALGPITSSRYDVVGMFLEQALRTMDAATAQGRAAILRILGEASVEDEFSRVRNCMDIIDNVTEILTTEFVVARGAIIEHGKRIEDNSNYDREYPKEDFMPYMI